jgi:hypothetical protein
VALWPRPLPRWYWAWQQWVDNDREGPRPKDAPRLIPPWAWARYLLHRGTPPPKPQTPPSLFSDLGGFVAQAGSFPPDTAGARAFQQAGGKWLTVQFGDPTTDPGNRQAFSQGWAERWRALGVQVGCWWRVEQVGLPIPVTPPVDFRVPNPEQPHEMARMQDILRECRRVAPSQPLAAITLGKALAFPTGALETYDAHLILECFLETPRSDTTVENSVRYWLASTVPAHRIHPCLLHKTGGLPQPPLAVSKAQAAALGVTGFSSYVAENTPAIAWSVMA